MNTKSPYYILHGFEGYPGENWFPWLKEELEKRGEKVIVPTLPNPDKPQLDEWLAELKREVDIHGPGTIIGHSLGGVLAIHYLLGGGFPHRIFLVATPFEKLEKIPEIDNFFEPSPYPKDEDKNVISRVEFKIFHSGSDPYVPISHAESWAKILNTDLILVPNKGHINTPTFPEILDYL